MKKIKFLAFAAVIAAMFFSCSSDPYGVDPVSEKDGGIQKQTIVSDYSNVGSQGVLVVQEGNMTTENGFLSFIDRENPCTYYSIVGGSRFGNVAQDLYIHDGKIYVVCQNVQKGSRPGSVYILNNTDFTPAVSAPVTTPISGVTNPTHIAVYDANTVFVRGSGTNYDGTGSGFGIYRFNPNSSTAAERLDDGDKVVAPTTMALVGKYLYVCYNDGLRVYDATSTGKTPIGKVGTTAFQCVVKNTAGTKVYAYSSRNIYEITPVDNASAITLSPLIGTTTGSISTFSNSAQLSYYNNKLYYVSGSRIRSFDLSTGQNQDIAPVYTADNPSEVVGSVIYNGVAVDPGTGFLYQATTVYGNDKNGVNYSNRSALNVYDVNNNMAHKYSYLNDERFTGGIFFPQNFGCTTVGTSTFDYVQTLPPYDPNQFYN